MDLAHDSWRTPRLNDYDLHVLAAEHFSKQRYEDAFSIYESLSEKGYVPCQVYAGWMLFEGVGITRDRTRGIVFLRQAAERQDSKGMFYLGRALALEGKLQEAMLWYKKAADQVYSPANFRLGLAYLNGSGTQPDRTLGISYLRKAAESGHVLAKRELALQYMSGKCGIDMIPKGLVSFVLVFVSAYRAVSRDQFAEELIG